jgi:hypothetical protein
MGSPSKCAHCGEMIRVHESSIVVEWGQARETSPIAERKLARLEQWHYHRMCHEALYDARQPADF